MAENEVETPSLPPYQITSALLHSLPPSTTCTAMVLPTPSLNASCTLISGRTTYSECNEVKCLSGADAIIDEIGAELMYVTLAYIVTVVVMCSSVHRRVACNAVTAAPTVVSAPLSNIQAPIPSKVVEVSSGCVEGVSTARGDNSSSESNSGDPSEQAHTGNISAEVEISDDSQHLQNSREESSPNVCPEPIVNPPTQPHWQSTGIPPVAAVKKKKRGTGTSGTKQQRPTAGPPRVVLVPPNPVLLQPPNSGGTWGEETDEGRRLNVPSSMPSPPSESDGIWAEETDEGGGRNRASSVHSSHLESNGIWAEETDEGGGRNIASPVYPSHSATAEPSLLHSDSDASWAEETREEHHDITSPHESSQDETESDSPGATTSSAGESSPGSLMHLDEPDVAMVLAEPGPFPGGGPLLIVQMIVMEPQPPLQPEAWPMHLPEQESEEGRNGPSQLVP